MSDKSDTALWDIECVEPWRGDHGDYVFVWDGGPIEAATADEAIAIFKRDHAGTYDNVDAAWAVPSSREHQQ